MLEKQPTSYHDEVMALPENPENSEVVYEQTAAWYNLVNQALRSEKLGIRVVRAISLRRDPYLLQILHQRGICTEPVPALSPDEMQAIDEHEAFPEPGSEGAQLLETQQNLYAERFNPDLLFELFNDLQRLTNKGVRARVGRFLKRPRSQ